jgi:hypothetical protein
MIESNRRAYKKWLTAGQQSLLQFPLYEEDQSVPDSPERIAIISEKATALLATIAGSERAASWNALRESMKGVAAEERLRAIRPLRELGMVTGREYAALVEMAMRDRYLDRTIGDRECRRELKACRGQDINERIRTACLREVDEHDLANLRLTDRNKYREHVDWRFAELPYEWEVERGDRAAARERDPDLLRRNEEDAETIRRYALNLMPLTESAAFEKRLLTDAQFFERLASTLSVWMTGRPVLPALRRRLDKRRGLKWYDRFRAVEWLKQRWADRRT